jgi:Tectonin domain
MNPTEETVQTRKLPAISRAILLVLLSIAGVLGTATPSSAATVNWTLLPGRASDIGVGASGAVWAIGTNPVPGGYGIHQYVNGQWVAIAGGAVRVAVGPDGWPWIVNSDGRIFRRSGSSWVLLPGSARDIAVGGDGNAYIIGTTPVPGGYRIYRYVETFGSWVEVGGGAVRIAAGTEGRPWVVNSDGRVFRMDGGSWTALPGTARDVGAGGGRVWIVGTNPVPGGYGIRVFDGVDWDPVPGGGVAISAGRDGDPWLVNSYGEIFRGVASGFNNVVCPGGDTAVLETSSSVLAGTLQPGESVRLSPNPAYKIWAGVALTGQNGPEGWNTTAPRGYPLPGARHYSLLVDSGGGWRYLGATAMTITNTTGNPQALRFRVNDDVPGNGSGAFRVSSAFTCRS